MIEPRRVTTVVLTMVFSLGLMLSAGCTKYASPDDLQQLEEARKAAISAEKELDRVKAERSDVAQELADKEAELKVVQEELDYVKAHVETTPETEEETGKEGTGEEADE